MGLLFPLDVKACFWHGGCSPQMGNNPAIVKEQNEAMRRTVIIILDDNQQRALREEAALERALTTKRVNAAGMSHYGGGFIARSGMEDSLPVIEIDGLYYVPPKKGEELTYEGLCSFLDLMIEKGIVHTISA